ncbi:sulfur carrier protein ThiS [Granulicella sibirica]|uniref:Sulfur carrier protein ThiS n=1 Tax=Granulicella sibirica TaxID=2479048 RepID=A0A4Q0T5H1_9BACT|nr:sulfur carrier protein ThiS [Granulicella sibirica]RXH56821.1 Sulfur carrier protein ThiS [Granulicella sibirica]
MSLTLTLNGQARSFDALGVDASLADLVVELGLKGDRIALERNGEIVSRQRWGETVLADGDKLELVHFVGGGSVEATAV